MNKQSFVSLNAVKSQGGLSSFLSFGPSALLSVLGILFITLVIPLSVYSADKLIVQDSSGNQKFSARDDGSIMLNTGTFDGLAGSLIYGAASASKPMLTFDSFGTSELGGGGVFRFARGSQSAKAATQNGDRLGFLVFGGYDGGNFLNTAALSAYVEDQGSVTSGSVPTKFVFETSSAGYPRTKSMVISSSGNVGIGQTSPSYPLHMGSGAYVTTGGVWTNASSREYKENIQTLTSSEANQTLDGLNPVRFSYKANKEVRHVGFIAEEVPELVATQDRKGLSPMDIVAVLTKVIQEQKNAISELSQKVDSMQQEMNKAKGLN
ncbi:MAG: tail fiber domain-containing protein [Syntrophales bacterium]